MSNSRKTEDFEKVNPVSDKAPIAYYIVADQKSSGFILEGTEHLPQPNEITAPSLLRIRSTSHYFKKDKEGIDRRVNIRYIKGCEEIEVEKQKKAGIEPNRMEDVILIKRGHFAIVREGNDIGLFDFLRKSSANKTNEERDKQCDIRYLELVPEKENFDLNELEFAKADALAKVRALVLSSRSAEETVYDEAKLDIYCTLFQISGPNNATKINSLIRIAQEYPNKFIEQVETLEQRFAHEIIQAEEMHVIAFKQTHVEYVKTPEIILSFTGAFVKTDVNRERLSTYFQSKDGAVAYQKFLVELEKAKNESLGN